MRQDAVGLVRNRADVQKLRAPRCRHDTPLSIAPALRQGYALVQVLRVFWGQLRVVGDYNLDATKLALMSIYAKLLGDRSGGREQLGMTYPSSSSMSSNTNLLLKTAGGPAAVSK
jgi:hypothetical protein